MAFAANPAGCGLRKAPAGQKIEDARQKRDVFGARGVAEIGDAADIPQQFDPLRRGQLFQHLRAKSHRYFNASTSSASRARASHLMRRCVKAADQPIHRAEFQIVIAPFSFAHRIKAVFLNGLSGFFIQRAHLTRHAKGAVYQMPPRPARDLRQFLRIKRPPAPSRWQQRRCA